MARDGLRQSVHDYENTLQQLERELQETREQHQAAQQEVVSFTCFHFHVSIHASILVLLCRLLLSKIS